MLHGQSRQPQTLPTAYLCLHGSSAPAETDPSLVSTDAPKEQPKWVK